MKDGSREGRLSARPGRVATPPRRGTLMLGLAPGKRDSLLHVPASYSPEKTAPFALMLHGSGGNAREGLELLQEQSEKRGIILLAPDARGATWDIIYGAYGPDVEYIDRALARVFDNYSIDPSCIAIGGFSDGASYALSLGMLNGDLFTHVIAFSPCFADTSSRLSIRPGIFISHGTRDEVLPIERCSRWMVPILKQAGYKVQYQEFIGAHTVSPEIIKIAVTWFLGKKQ